MYKIEYYKTQNGRQPVKEYIDMLAARKDKDSKIKFEKISDYIFMLANMGLSAGEPYMKHLEGEIWELRPLQDRVLFAKWDGTKFVLLSQFIKKTQKTPRREIEKAKRYLKDYEERNGRNEK